MKPTFLLHLFFLLVGLSNSYAQAKKSNIMILPSDNWSEQLLLENESISNDYVINSSDSIVYINSLKCKLVIRNKKEKGFEYTLFNKGQIGSCSELDDFVGEAYTNEAGDPPHTMFEDAGVIKFTIQEDWKFISAEPQPTWVGYDCAGKFDYSFELLINPEEGELTENENGKSFPEKDAKNISDNSREPQTSESEEDNVDLSSETKILTMIFEDFYVGDDAHLIFIDISNREEFDFRFLSDNNLSGVPILIDDADADATFELKANPDYLKRTFIVEIKKKSVKDSDFDGNVFETMEWVITSIKLN